MTEPTDDASGLEQRAAGARKRQELVRRARGCLRRAVPGAVWNFLHEEYRAALMVVAILLSSTVVKWIVRFHGGDSPLYEWLVRFEEILKVVMIVWVLIRGFIHFIRRHK